MHKHPITDHKERRIPKEVTRIDNRPVAVRRLTCGTAGCGYVGEIIDNSSGGLMTSLVLRRFEAKGWETGSKDGEDFCPPCSEARTRARRLKRNPHRGEHSPQAVNLRVIEGGDEVVSQEPQQMGREDRRLIFAKLQEVYVDESAGYQTPWSDAAVAKDLGVAQGWVATIREENFGPAKDNQEVRDMLERVAHAATEANGVLSEAKEIRKEGAALVERINALNHRATEIGHTLSGLLVLADRIRAAVS